MRAAFLAAALPLLGASNNATDPVAATKVALQRAKAESARQKRAPVSPREAYLNQSTFGSTGLSPDGRYVSYHRRGAQGADVMLHDLSTGAQTRLVAGIENVMTAWSGNGRTLWIADDQGLSAVAMEDRRARRVLKWDGRRHQRFWRVDPAAPQYAIIHERIAQAGTEQHRYVRVDMRGATSLLMESARPVRSMLLTSSGDLAFTASFDGPQYETAIRQHTPAGNRQLLRCATTEDCRLVGYNSTRQTLWILSQKDDDRLSLRKWSRGRWERVHADPERVADVDDIVWSSAREDWLAISYHGARRRWYANGDAATSVLRSLAKHLPGSNLQFSPSSDGRVWLVRAQHASSAADRYYLYRTGVNRIQQLFTRETVASPASPPGVSMHPVSYRARDGMLLHGYIMLPAGVDAAKAPLVAWLHGGPVARIYDRYDAPTQMLANRGNAVFVPNFRASTGYGLRYVLSARGDVGNGRVLADVIDGMDFILAQGIGSRGSQAVMGMSFGGYASLLALTHHPSRFRFAFAGAPPTEYGWIKEWQAEHDNAALRGDGPPLALQFPLLGFRYGDADWRAKMQRESPLAGLAALRAPVYLWAGTRDDRVPIKSVVNYAGEARRKGKELTLLIDPAGGHTPSSQLGSEAALYLMELAAHRHFGGKLSPASPQLETFLKRNIRIDHRRSR